MCHMYSATNPCRYESTTRSVRLRGYVTSVRLENEFWETLETMAVAQSMTVPHFIAELYDEALEEKGEVNNLASLLRVACAIHLANMDSAFARCTCQSPAEQVFRPVQSRL